jgi:thioredoxin reductase (NADPH)
MAREDFTPLVITGTSSGGQLLMTSSIENFPAFPNGINGADLVDLMKKQAERFGSRFVERDVTSVDFNTDPLRVMVDSDEYLAKSVIVASGASSKWLNIPSERKFIGRGVSSCATCDAPFFKNKNVLVVGGGDTAMEDSIFLAKFAKSVTIVHRKSRFRASKIMQERVMSEPKISIIWNSIVEEILGNSKVTGVKLLDSETGVTAVKEVEGIFLAIGNIPNTKYLVGSLALDTQGYVLTKNEVKTDIEGVFVAGDVGDRRYRQAVTAAASGAKAALEDREYLQSLKFIR